MRSPSFTGPYTSSNPSAAHIPPSTLGPALSTRQRSYGASGVAASSTYVPADARPSSTTRATGGEPLPPSCSLKIHNRVPKSGTSAGHVPSQSRSSGSTIPSSNHQSRPRCKLPQCQKAAIFDNRIHEYREFCEDHIMYVLKDMFSCESSSLNVFL